MKLQRNHIFFGLFLLLFLGAYTWGTYIAFTSHVTGGNDFYSRYIAWQAFLFDGRNPYSDDVTNEIQMKMMGHLAAPGEDQNALIYPWYAVLVQFPFVYLPWPWARAVYMVLCQVFIVIGLLLTARMVQWKPGPLLLALTVAWAIFFYPEGRGIILGQIGITQYLFAVLAVWYYLKKRDVVAAICLAFTTVRPTPIFLFVPFLLLYAFARKRMQFVGVFSITMVILVLTGFLFLPHWLTDWLYRVGNYPSYTVGESPVWLLTHQLTPLGTFWEYAISAVCLLGLFYAWWLVIRAPADTALQWGIGITFLVSDLIVPRSATTNYIFLLFPIYLIFARIKNPRLVIGLQLASLIGLWVLFFATVQVNQEQPIMYIPHVVVLGVVLIAGYRWLTQPVGKINPVVS